MKAIDYILIGTIVCIILYFIWTEGRFDQVIVGGNIYSVQSQFQDSSEAAELLARINNRVMIFLRHLKNKYGTGRYNTGDDTKNGMNAAGIAARILSNYNPEVIRETDPIVSSDTSYTIDKGKQLYICMRSKSPPYALTNADDLFFVVLHELSHMGTTTFGHNIEFWRTFKFVLREAEAAGVYIPVDYSKRGVKYCGLDVNYNPYFDESVESIPLGTGVQ